MYFKNVLKAVKNANFVLLKMLLCRRSILPMHLTSETGPCFYLLFFGSWIISTNIHTPVMFILFCLADMKMCFV